MVEKEILLSSAEERFEKWRTSAGLFAGPVIFIVLYLLPFPGLSHQAHQLAAVLGWVGVWWITEAIPVPMTALLGAVLNTLMGVASAKEICGPFADPIVFLFIGSFILAQAMMVHGLDRRFALSILSFSFVSKSPARILVSCGLISAAISAWVSNTATTVMMLPIALGVLGAMGHDHRQASRHGYASGIMLMIAYGASVGGISTIIGTPPNLIGVGLIQSLAGTRITFFEWMVMAVPLVIVMFLFLALMLTWFHRVQKGAFHLSGDEIHKMRHELGRWGRGQLNTLIAFSAAVLLWILPSLLGLCLGKDATLIKNLAARLDEGVVAILAASLLFILPTDWKKRTFTMSWEEALKIDWGTILLFGGGLSLGKLMFSTGLAEALGKWILSYTGADGLWGLTAVGIASSILVSELTSNTASANMVIPVMIALAQSMSINPIPPALGACLGSSFGFMLPISTPPNAIVYGSGRVSLLSMVRMGIIFDIAGFFIIWGGLRLMCPWMGWV